MQQRMVTDATIKQFALDGGNSGDDNLGGDGEDVQIDGESGFWNNRESFWGFFHNKRFNQKSRQKWQ